MIFLDLCAVILRNRHLARPWLKALARGCELASADQEFARDERQLLRRPRRPPVRDPRADVDTDRPGPRARLAPFLTGARGARRPAATTVPDLARVAGGVVALVSLSDPLWHARWAVDVQRKWARVLPAAGRAAAIPASRASRRASP